LDARHYDLSHWAVYGGAAGEPRRTNLGVSYSDPHSPLYHPEWHFGDIMGCVGGIIMTIAGLMFFVVFLPRFVGRPQERERSI
jgi:cytochrome c oxidase subunit 1